MQDLGIIEFDHLSVLPLQNFAGPSTLLSLYRIPLRQNSPRLPLSGSAVYDMPTPLLHDKTSSKLAPETEKLVRCAATCRPWPYHYFVLVKPKPSFPSLCKVADLDYLA